MANSLVQGVGQQAAVAAENESNQSIDCTPKGNGILGLVAGDGKLPAILARSAKERGYKVVSFALSEGAYHRVMPHSEKVHLLAPGQLGRNLKLIQEESVEQVVFIGKLNKIELLKNIYKLDWTAVRELSKLTDFSDDSIQSHMGKIMGEYGVEVLGQTQFLKHLFPGVGVMTKNQPTPQEYADIQYGKRIAKEIARLDVGQTVVVREEMILAIEAIEGTDECIRRAVELARAPVVVIKVAKQGHDPRFDMPAVGLNTLNSMVGPKPGGVLAVEAGQTMLVEKDDMIAFAQRHGMSIVAV